MEDNITCPRVEHEKIKYLSTSGHVIFKVFVTSLPMCGFIDPLVEHRNGIAEVKGSNPIEALIFSGFFFPIA